MNNNIKHLENGDFEVVSFEETAHNWYKEALNFEKELLKHGTVGEIQFHAGAGGGKVRCTIKISHAEYSRVD